MSTKKEMPEKPNFNTTATAKPTATPLPTKPTYDTTSYDSTKKGQAALGAMNNAQSAYDNFEFNPFSQQEWLNNVFSGIQNYGEFSYDMNGDALYQQYKDKYIQQGKMAMADTMGQAAAMTGGYGNSYAQSVGQQAYQGQLNNLNDIIPQLYQMALDKYNMGKQDLYNQHGMLSSEREHEYGLQKDEYGRLLDALGISQDNYYRGADMYHTEQANRNNIAGQKFNDAMAIWGAENDQAWKEYDADETARRDANNLLQQNYQNEFGVWEAENDEDWKDKQFDLSDRELDTKEEAWEIEKKEAGYTVDENGNVVPVETPTPKFDTSISLADMVSNAWAYADEGMKADYLAAFVNAGRISQEDALKVLNGENIISLTNRTWDDTYDGGFNWWGGVDTDAIVKDQYGNKFTLKELKEALIDEGMTSKEAKQYLKELQEELGI